MRTGTHTCANYTPGGCCHRTYSNTQIMDKSVKCATHNISLCSHPLAHVTCADSTHAAVHSARTVPQQLCLQVSSAPLPSLLVPLLTRCWQCELHVPRILADHIITSSDLCFWVSRRGGGTHPTLAGHTQPSRVKPYCRGPEAMVHSMKCA